MSKCIIFGAAEIRNYEKISSFIQPGDFIIACDGGLTHIEQINARGLSPRSSRPRAMLLPDLIVGDFDSHEKPADDRYAKAKIIQLPHEKDDTDLFYAAKEAVKSGYRDFIILGAIGNRFDHSLCNISVLLYLKSQNAKAVIIDDYSQMEIIGETDTEPALISGDYSYFSLMCVDGKAQQITIRNAKYLLENAEITTQFQYGISNEVLPGKTAEVQVKKGNLLLVKVW